MGWRFALGLSIALLLHSTLRANERDPRILLRTSDLRSAYLVRAGVVSYGGTDRSPQSLKRQLKRHFDVVIGLLLANSPRSIETALARLEQAADQSWSNNERSAWREKLIAMRYVQLRRLAAYRDRGLFPQNEGESSKPVPIFVDQHDTACAVGQLMRWSGRNDGVASIQNDNNFVYVPDAPDGPIREWILESGLTIEEAALIQPSYGPHWVRPEIPEDALKPLGADWSHVAGDLRFSNFKLQYWNNDGTDPAVNASVSHYTRPGNLYGFLGHDKDRVLVQFDVELTSPHLLFEMPAFATSLYVRQSDPIYYARNSVSLFLSEDLADLFFHHAEPESDTWPDGNYYNFGLILDHTNFAPTNRMTVVTDMVVEDGTPLEALILQFSVIAVPEPASVWLLACGGAALAFGRRFNRQTASSICNRG
jgi:hypothetical protein